MTDEQIANEVCTLIAGQIEVDAGEVTPEKKLEEDLLFDDLNLIEVIIALEDHFELAEIPDDEGGAWKTVGDVIAYMQKALAPKATPT